MLTPQEDQAVRNALAAMIDAGMGKEQAVGIVIGLLMTEPGERRQFPLLEVVYQRESEIRSNLVTDALMSAADALMSRDWDRCRRHFTEVDRLEGRS